MLYILLAAAHPFYDGDIRRMFKKVKAGNLVFGERVWTYITNDAKVCTARLEEFKRRCGEYSVITKE